jgi:hypothetical protein
MSGEITEHLLLLEVDPSECCRSRSAATTLPCSSTTSAGRPTASQSTTPTGASIGPMGAEWSKNDGFIDRVDFDGSNRTTIVPEGATFTPKQLQIDAEAGLIY